MKHNVLKVSIPWKHPKECSQTWGSQLPWSRTDRRLSLVATEMSRCWDRGWWGCEFPPPAGSTQALVTCGPLHPTRGKGCPTSPWQPGCSSFPSQADPCPSLGIRYEGGVGRKCQITCSLSISLEMALCGSIMTTRVNAAWLHPQGPPDRMDVGIPTLQWENWGVVC